MNVKKIQTEAFKELLARAPVTYYRVFSPISNKEKIVISWGNMSSAWVLEEKEICFALEKCTEVAILARLIEHNTSDVMLSASESIRQGYGSKDVLRKYDGPNISIWVNDALLQKFVDPFEVRFFAYSPKARMILRDRNGEALGFVAPVINVDEAPL